MDKLFYNAVPCEYETELRVTQGALPNWLNGNLYRVGPGLFDLDKGFTVNHWFDGAAILFRYRFTPNSVTCLSRYLNTDAFKKMRIVGRPVYTEFGTRAYPDTTKSMFSRLINRIVPSELTDNVHGNIYSIGDNLYCASETCNIWQINPNTLEAETKIDLSKVVGVHLASSHPHVESDGTIINFGTSFLTGLKYHLFKIDPGVLRKTSSGIVHRSKDAPSDNFPESTTLATLSSSWNTLFSYSHSFANTKNYIVIIEQPMLINLMKLVSVVVKQLALREAFEWRGQDTKARFRIINKETGNELPGTYYGPAFFCLHTVNAYEDGNHIVLDLVAYDDARTLDKFYLPKLRANEYDNSLPQPTIRRFVLPIVSEDILKSKHRRRMNDNLNELHYSTSSAVRSGEDEVTITPEYLLDPAFEIPTINRKYDGRDYEYVYGSGLFEKNRFENKIIKFSVKSKLHRTWNGNPTQYPGEALFIPRPGANEEDDGLIISTVSDLRDNHDDFLLILDASNLEEVARVSMGKVPLCPTVHGLWIPKESVSSLEDVEVTQSNTIFIETTEASELTGATDTELAQTTEAIEDADEVEEAQITDKVESPDTEASKVVTAPQTESTESNQVKEVKSSESLISQSSTDNTTKQL